MLVLSLALAIPACGSDPQSPATPSSISGTVVFEQTGSPAPGVDVIFEMQTGTLMMQGHWDQSEHMMTNSQGQFHFDYMRDSMHSYRVGVSDVTERHMCNSYGKESGVVLHIPPQSP